MVKDSKKVGIVMGSKSDEPVMKQVSETLDMFGVEYEVHVLSAHRMPNKTREFALGLEKSGIKVIIAGAGKAAALPGTIAAFTTLPVIGIPIKTSGLGGMDSLLSMVQMPPGVPVACMAIDGSKNAALMAVEILALGDEKLAAKLTKFKKDLEY